MIPVETMIRHVAPIVFSWVISDTLSYFAKEYFSKSATALIHGGVYGVVCQGGMKITQAPENTLCLVSAATQYVFNYLGK